jgi:serralysin
MMEMLNIEARESNPDASAAAPAAEPTQLVDQTITETADARNDTFTTYTMSPGDTFKGYIDPKGDMDGTAYDSDWIKVTFEAGMTYEISMAGSGSNPLARSWLELRDGSGQVLDYDGDGNSVITFTAQESGTYYIAAEDYDFFRGGTYQISLEASTLPPWPEPGVENLDQLARYLTDGFWIDFGEGPQSWDTSTDNIITVDITKLTDEGKQLARWAFEAWEMVADLDFVEIEPDAGDAPANITFDDDVGLSAYSYSTVRGTTIIESNIRIGTAWLEYYGTTIDSYSFQSYVHEIGHSLGLGHQGDYNVTADYPLDATFENDSWQISIMSYFSQTDNTNINASFAWIVTPMMADLVAIQNLYGAPDPRDSATAGDTIYGANSTLDNYLGSLFDAATGGGSDVFYGDNFAYTIYDRSGIDTIDVSFSSENQYLDLREESFSNVAGLTGNLAIARGTTIENGVTGSGNDLLHGNSVDNALNAGAGDDLIDGGSGTDTAIYGVTRASATITAVGDGSVRIVSPEGTDTLRNVEYVAFSDETVDIRNFRNKITGNDANNTLTGTDIWEHIVGLGGDDTAYGNGGSDLLEGGDGNDVLHGGTGNDVLYGDAGDDYLSGGSGNDAAAGGVGVDRLFGGGGNDTLYGGAQNDSLDGGDGNDKLYGDDGDDTASGGDGDDHLYGGNGADTLQGYAGNDVLYGDAGDDYLSGGSDNDALAGGGGADQLFGGGGTDTLYGGAQNDTLDGGAGDDELYGDDGDDYLDGDDGNDLLKGGNGVDTLHGYAGNDVLYGDAGDDYLSGGSDNDAASGGLGADRLFGGGGTDTLYGGAQNDTLDGGAGDDELYGDDGDDYLDGDDGNDLLKGGNGVDTLHGYAGNDVLYGDAGDDYLSGGSDNDALAGGLGADRLFGGGGTDTLYGGAQNDRLDGGAGDDKLYGDDGDDYLDGGDGNDLLKGGNGVDTLHGYAGNDILYGEAGDDYLSGGAGNDAVAGGGGADRLFGGGGTDTLYGGAQNDTLDGGAGDDELYGDDGDDDLDGGDGNDLLKGGAGEDTFVFRAGYDADIIVDFENNVDTLVFTDLGNLSEIQAAASQVGSDVVFDFGDGDVLTVRDTMIDAIIDDISIL